MKTLRILSLALLALAIASGAARADFTFGDFEGFTYVNTSNVNVGLEQTGINFNNGPPPVTTGPYAKTTYFGNSDSGNTGWGDWRVTTDAGGTSYDVWSQFGPSAIGVTSGTRSVKVVPASFPNPYVPGQTITGTTFTQNLAVAMQVMPDPLGDDMYTNYMANKYLAFDVTFRDADWTGSANGLAALRVWFNQGAEGSTFAIGQNPAPTRFGFQELGNYVPPPNPGDPTPARTPTLDTGDAAAGTGHPGQWRIEDAGSTYTTTLYYRYDDWEFSDGTHWDSRSFTGPGLNDGDTSYTEIIIGTGHSTAFTGGAIYYDNFRWVSSLPGGLADNGDYDDNGTVNAADIDILWHIVRGATTDPGANDTPDLNHDSLVNEDDVDLMLSAKVPSAAHKYGDADIDADVDGADFDAWRLRAGYTGSGSGHWSIGDFDGDGDVDGADFDLWRLRPSAYPTNVGAHGDGGSLVPEPSTLVLLSLALPALGLIARRRSLLTNQ